MNDLEFRMRQSGVVAKSYDANWEESKHPRADNGQFSSSRGGGSSKEEKKQMTGNEAAVKAMQGAFEANKKVARASERSNDVYNLMNKISEGKSFTAGKESFTKTSSKKWKDNKGNTLSSSEVFNRVREELIQNNDLEINENSNGGGSNSASSGLTKEQRAIEKRKQERAKMFNEINSPQGKAEQEKAKKELLSGMHKNDKKWEDFDNNLSTRVAEAKKGYSGKTGHALTDNNIGKEVEVSKDIKNGFGEQLLKKGDKVIVSHSGGLTKNQLCVLRNDGRKVFITAGAVAGLDKGESKNKEAKKEQEIRERNEKIKSQEIHEESMRKLLGTVKKGDILEGAPLGPFTNVGENSWVNRAGVKADNESLIDRTILAGGDLSLKRKGDEMLSIKQMNEKIPTKKSSDSKPTMDSVFSRIKSK